ncbi:MAG: MFS transporter [Pseudomonadota bacterium]
MPWRILSFGLLLSFSSSFGQTHFVSLFNESFRSSFGLSHGEIGFLYACGTLASAATLVWVGRWIDWMDLRRYTLLVMAGLIVACLSASLVSSAIVLGLVFYLLRLFGQGLSGHVAVTTVSRHTDSMRGRALSITGIGHSLGEVVFPALVVAAIAAVGWRATWGLAATLQLMIMAVALVLIWPARTRSTPESIAQAVSDRPSWTLGMVLRDRRYMALLPMMLAQPCIVTALFFHQQSLAAHQTVPFLFWASGIAAYSLAVVLVSLGAGFMVDRFSGGQLVRFGLLPLILSPLVLIATDVGGSHFLYFVLMGSCVGYMSPTLSALWVELYGMTHLGAVRSFNHAFMVFSSALGPVVFGALLDLGLNWDTLLLSSAAFCLMATAVMWWVPFQYRSPSA